MTFSAVITAVFTVGYLAVTAWLCRGLRLNTRALCYGGLMCAADHTPESEAVSWDAICRLSALVDGDWGELDGVPAAASIQRETHQIVEEWGEYYLERPIRSMRLLD